MNDEQKPFEFAELPQPVGNGPAQEPVKRKRGRRRGTTAKTVRTHRAAPTRDELVEVTNPTPSKMAGRRELILKAITAMQFLEQADARYVASLFA